jgi:hypothetical protein
MREYDNDLFRLCMMPSGDEGRQSEELNIVTKLSVKMREII